MTEITQEDFDIYKQIMFGTTKEMLPRIKMLLLARDYSFYDDKFGAKLK